MAMLAGMMIFTSGLQMLSSGLNSKSDANNEFNRQKGICDEVTNTENNITKMDTMLQELTQDKSLADKTSDELLTMSQDIGASIASYKSLSSHYTQRLLIMIIINIVVVTFLCLYIITKTDS